MPDDTEVTLACDAIEVWGADRVLEIWDIHNGRLSKDRSDAVLTQTPELMRRVMGGVTLGVQREGPDARPHYLQIMMELGWALRERWEAEKALERQGP